MKSPKVSVLMSAYNNEKYLKKAVESILNQTFKSFEFLIINDGSTDETVDILKSCKDSRIKIINNNKNIGLTKSLNKGLAIAQGKYIARMDADDISLPERLAKQVDFLEAHPAVGVVGSAVQLIDDSGKPSFICSFPSEHGFIKWCLYFYNPIPHPVVLMRRNVIDKVGGYTSHTIYAQDYDLWGRLSGVARLANLPDVLLYLRKHDANVSHSHLTQQRSASIKISLQIISAVIDQKVPRDVLQCIWSQHFKTKDEVRHAAKLIAELYHANIADSTLSGAEKRMIRKDAASRLFALAWPRMRDVHMWNILTSVCLLDPLLVSRAITRDLHKIVNKLIRG